MKKIWRCDLKSPCVKFCESENEKHLCGIRIKDKRNKMKKYKTIYLLELDSVSRSRDIMKASAIWNKRLHK